VLDRLRSQNGIVMKKNFVLLAGVLVSTLAFASGPGDGSKRSGLAVVKKNETTFNLFYQRAGLSDVRVSLLDAKGNQVFSESIKKTRGFNRPYNFSSMEKGEYTFMVEDGNGKQTHNFVYSDSPSPRVASVVKLDDHRYILSVSEKLFSGKMYVKIYGGSKLIHDQSYKITGDFAQVFALNNIDETISFEVTDSKGNKIN